MAKSRLIGEYPVIGIRPTIDGRRGPLKVRESLEDQTMNMAKAAAKLFEENLRYSNGEPVKVVISDTTIGRVAESAACAEQFKKAGVDIYGIDASYEMLSHAVEKAGDLNLDILFLCQKMQSIDLYGTIDTCVCTLDSINHLTDINDVQKTFDRVSLFMNKGGYFLFDANTIYKHEKVLADNTFVYESEDVFCVWQNSIKENNVVEIELDFFEREGECYYRTGESFCERAYSDEELTSMLEKAGFEVVERFSDMTFDSPKDDDQRVVYIARKK